MGYGYITEKWDWIEKSQNCTIDWSVGFCAISPGFSGTNVFLVLHMWNWLTRHSG
jgi:hypothetical protein